MSTDTDPSKKYTKEEIQKVDKKLKRGFAVAHRLVSLYDHSTRQHFTNYADEILQDIQSVVFLLQRFEAPSIHDPTTTPYDYYYDPKFAAQDATLMQDLEKLIDEIDQHAHAIWDAIPKKPTANRCGILKIAEDEALSDAEKVKNITELLAPLPIATEEEILDQAEELFTDLFKLQRLVNRLSLLEDLVAGTINETDVIDVLRGFDEFVKEEIADRKEFIKELKEAKTDEQAEAVREKYYDSDGVPEWLHDE